MIHPSCGDMMRHQSGIVPASKMFPSWLEGPGHPWAENRGMCLHSQEQQQTLHTKVARDGTMVPGLLPCSPRGTGALLGTVAYGAAPAAQVSGSGQLDDHTRPSPELCSAAFSSFPKQG